MSVTAALVKELREKSGAGMMDCKKALNETEGDVDAAVDWLRKKRSIGGGEEIWSGCRRRLDRCRDGGSKGRVD